MGDRKGSRGPGEGRTGGSNEIANCASTASVRARRTLATNHSPLVTRFLIDTPTIRNEPKSLKIKESDPV
jgi:hypothetical protein